MTNLVFDNDWLLYVQKRKSTLISFLGSIEFEQGRLGFPERYLVAVLFCFVLFCFVLFCFVLFCFVLFGF